MPPPGPGPRGSLLSPLHSGPARHPRARSRRSLSPLSVSPVPPGPAQAGRTPALAGRARPSPFRARAPPPPLPPAGTGSPPTRHLELQQLLGLLRRQLPLLRRRHFVAASDPSLRHSPELTSAHPHFRPGSRARARARARRRKGANGLLSAATGNTRPRSGESRSAPGPIRKRPNLIDGARRSRVFPMGARRVPKCAESRSDVSGAGRGRGGCLWPRERVPRVAAGSPSGAGRAASQPPGRGVLPGHLPSRRVARPPAAAPPKMAAAS